MSRRIGAVIAIGIGMFVAAASHASAQDGPRIQRPGVDALGAPSPLDAEVAEVPSAPASIRIGESRRDRFTRLARRGRLITYVTLGVVGTGLVSTTLIVVVPWREDPTWERDGHSGWTSSTGKLTMLFTTVVCGGLAIPIGLIAGATSARARRQLTRLEPTASLRLGDGFSLGVRASF